MNNPSRNKTLLEIIRQAKTDTSKSIAFEKLIAQPTDETLDFECMISEAAHSGCLAIVQYLVEKGTNVDSNYPANKKRTVLHRAASGGHTEVVKFLLSKNADINVYNSAYDTPLDQALQKGHVEVVQILLDSNANIDQTKSEPRRGTLGFTVKKNFTLSSTVLEAIKLILPKITSLEYLSSLLDKANELEKFEIAVLLLERYFKLQEGNTNTLLHYAVDRGRKEVVKLLLERGFLPTVALLEKCAKQNKQAVASLLIEKCGSLNLDGVLVNAATNGNGTLVRQLLNRGANPQVLNHEHSTLLYDAIEIEDLELIKLLLSQNIELNIGILSDSQQEFLARNLEALKLLDAAGVKINSIGKKLLVSAVRQNSIETAKFLLQNKVDADAGLVYEETPLHVAIENRNVEMVKLLLEAGANINALDDEEVTPLLLAIRLQYPVKFIEFLLEKGANLKAGVETPLHAAVFYRNTSLVTCLLERGADPNALDIDHLTPLHRAISENKYDHLINESGLFVTQRALVNLLLTKGAVVNPPSGVAWPTTPLHLAVSDIDLTKLLIENKANVNALDQDGNTPLQKTIKYPINRVVIENLIDAGADRRVLKETFFQKLKLPITSVDSIGCLTGLGVDIGSVDEQAPFRKFLVSTANNQNDHHISEKKKYVLWYRAMLMGLKTRLNDQDLLETIRDEGLKERLKEARLIIEEAYRETKFSIHDVSKGLRVLFYYFAWLEVFKDNKYPGILSTIRQENPQAELITHNIFRLPQEVIYLIDSWHQRIPKVKKFNVDLHQMFNPASASELSYEILFNEVDYLFHRDKPPIFKIYSDFFVFLSSLQDKVTDERMSESLNRPRP